MCVMILVVALVMMTMIATYGMSRTRRRRSGAAASMGEEDGEKEKLVTGREGG